MAASTDFECVALLLSSPSEASVAEAARPGVLRVTGRTLAWRGSGPPAVAPPAISVQLIDVKRLQKSPESKPDVKLRLAMGDDKAAAAYVFEFVGSEAKRNRDRLVECQKGVVEAAVAAAATNGGGIGGVADASRSASPLTGNLSERLSKGNAAMRRGALIGSDPLASFADPTALKEAVLTGSSALRAQYTSLVSSGILTDAAFWDGHKPELVRAALAKPKLGLSSQMPDELRAKDGGGGVKRVTMDRATMMAIFAKDHAAREAFGVMVPLKVTPKEFWMAYYRADEFRRKRSAAAAAVPQSASSVAAAAAAGAGRSGASAAAAASSAPASPSAPLTDRQREAALAAVRGMAPIDFFEAFRRGDFDPLMVTRTAAAGSSAGSSSSASRNAGVGGGGGLGGGLAFDLSSTIEDSVRASSLRNTESRSGYGTGEGGRVYALSELEARSMGVRDEDIVGEEARRGELIHHVNSYSAQVVEASTDEAGMGGGGGRWPSQQHS